MTKPRSLFLALFCTIASLTTGAAAAPLQELPDATPIQAAALTISYYTPQAMDDDALVELAAELFGPEIYVEQRSMPGQRGGATWISHFLVIGGSILIRDTNERAMEIRGELERLERTLEPWAFEPPSASPRTEEVVDYQYEPRHVSVSTLELALSRFSRQMTIPPLTSGAHTAVSTIIALPERNLLLVHDTSEQIERIKAFIAGIDQPIPQVTVTYYIVTGHDAPSENARSLPGDLDRNLKRLVPAATYELELSGVLRGSVNGKMTVEDQLRQMQLLLEPASFNAQEGILALKRCLFEYQKRSFATSATLHQGEYTVLGAAGDQPVFLVLKLTVG